MKLSRVIPTLLDVPLDGMRLPMFVVYRNPRDFPRHWAVRLWSEQGATEIVYLCHSLTEARCEIMRAQPLAVRLDPHPKDDPVIEEIWL